MSRRPAVRTRSIGVVAMTLLAVACSGDDPATSTATTVAEAPSTTVVSDRTLRIGLLVPQTGPGAALGASLSAGAELAIRSINQTAGVFGRDVVTVEADEGADTATAAASLDKLLDAGVDAIIGPASSSIAFGVLARAVEANVLVCSPTASAIGLSEFPDNRLFVRTMPSDALQAVELADAVERTGRRSTAIIAPDDAFGEAFAASLEQRFQSNSFEVDVSLRYDPLSEDLSGIADRAVESGAASVAVIGSGDSGAAMLAALRLTGTTVPIMVNDAFLDPAVAAALGDNADDILEGVEGVAIDARPVLPTFVDQIEENSGVSASFAGFAHDCANVIALAAVAANSDAAADMTNELVGVTTSGDSCASFAACSEGLEAGLNVDLTGLSGDLNLNRFGDITSGTFRYFRFDSNGRAISIS